MMTWTHLLKTGGTILIRVYQYAISPLLLPSCRFTPSCSEYARQAIERYGLGRGVAMGAKRLLRCHPFHPGGYDPPEFPPDVSARFHKRISLHWFRTGACQKRAGDHRSV